jgi:anti-sigma factor RsiW
MMHPEPPITDEELHAYVDGQLPTERACEVEEYLAANPGAASRVAVWRAQAAMIRDKWGRVAEEKVPERLHPARIGMPARGLGRKIAAAVVAFAIGVAAGWLGRDVVLGGRNAEIARVLADAAIEAHRIYTAEVRYPIEVRAEEAHLPALAVTQSRTTPEGSRSCARGAEVAGRPSAVRAARRRHRVLHV